MLFFGNKLVALVSALVLLALLPPASAGLQADKDPFKALYRDLRKRIFVDRKALVRASAGDADTEDATGSVIPRSFFPGHNFHSEAALDLLAAHYAEQVALQRGNDLQKRLQDEAAVLVLGQNSSSAGSENNSTAKTTTIPIATPSMKMTAPPPPPPRRRSYTLNRTPRLVSTSSAAISSMHTEHAVNLRRLAHLRRSRQLKLGFRGAEEGVSILPAELHGGEGKAVKDEEQLEYLIQPHAAFETAASSYDYHTLYTRLGGLFYRRNENDRTSEADEEAFLLKRSLVRKDAEKERKESVEFLLTEGDHTRAKRRSLKSFVFSRYRGGFESLWDGGVDEPGKWWRDENDKGAKPFLQLNPADWARVPPAGEEDDSRLVDLLRRATLHGTTSSRVSGAAENLADRTKCHGEDQEVQVAAHHLETSVPVSRNSIFRSYVAKHAAEKCLEKTTASRPGRGRHDDVVGGAVALGPAEPSLSFVHTMTELLAGVKPKSHRSDEERGEVVEKRASNNNNMLPARAGALPRSSSRKSREQIGNDPRRDFSQFLYAATTQDAFFRAASLEITDPLQPGGGVVLKFAAPVLLTSLIVSGRPVGVAAASETASPFSRTSPPKYRQTPQSLPNMAYLSAYLEGEAHYIVPYRVLPGFVLDLADPSMGWHPVDELRFHGGAGLRLHYVEVEETARGRSRAKKRMLRKLKASMIAGAGKATRSTAEAAVEEAKLLKVRAESTFKALLEEREGAAGEEITGIAAEGGVEAESGSGDYIGGKAQSVDGAEDLPIVPGPPAPAEAPREAPHINPEQGALDELADYIAQADEALRRLEVSLESARRGGKLQVDWERYLEAEEAKQKTNGQHEEDTPMELAVISHTGEISKQQVDRRAAEKYFVNLDYALNNGFKMLPDSLENNFVDPTLVKREVFMVSKFLFGFGEGGVAEFLELSRDKDTQKDFVAEFQLFIALVQGSFAASWRGHAGGGLPSLSMMLAGGGTAAEESSEATSSKGLVRLVNRKKRTVRDDGNLASQWREKHHGASERESGPGVVHHAPEAVLDEVKRVKVEAVAVSSTSAVAAAKIAPICVGETAGPTDVSTEQKPCDRNALAESNSTSIFSANSTAAATGDDSGLELFEREVVGENEYEILAPKRVGMVVKPKADRILEGRMTTDEGRKNTGGGIVMASVAGEEKDGSNSTATSFPTTRPRRGLLPAMAGGRGRQRFARFLRQSVSKQKIRSLASPEYWTLAGERPVLGRGEAAYYLPSPGEHGTTTFAFDREFVFPLQWNPNAGDVDDMIAGKMPAVTTASGHWRKPLVDEGVLPLNVEELPITSLVLAQSKPPNTSSGPPTFVQARARVDGESCLLLREEKYLVLDLPLDHADPLLLDFLATDKALLLLVEFGAYLALDRLRGGDSTSVAVSGEADEERTEEFDGNGRTEETPERPDGIDVVYRVPAEYASRLGLDVGPPASSQTTTSSNSNKWRTYRHALTTPEKDMPQLLVTLWQRFYDFLLLYQQSRSV